MARRSAQYEATLVYMDEPQLITLLSQKKRIVAVAIPHEDSSRSFFHATTVSIADWDKYLSGTVDLRYLFTYPKVRLHFHFDLHDMVDGKIMMEPWQGEIAEKYMPSPRFFSTNHTEDYEHQTIKASDKETLLIDGEWELTDFGQFQQKFSDVYAFIISAENWQDDSTPTTTKRKIKEAFLDRPFQGGFSYVHLFRDLADNIPPRDQLNLDKIQYASPGHVDVLGKESAFEALQEIIPNFVENRNSIHDSYRGFYQYLSENYYLRMSGNEFKPGDGAEKYINKNARDLSKMMLAPSYDTILDLADHNALVAAKIVLSLYRRLSDAASYFAQGRVAYSW
ncbi:hypothetical protein [Agrobacterium pusense]|uniref:hypothetical protein n=1 Tax=Agrobacterium pusense TaxID=648995 RepID=UPI00156B0E03|nr:hypothetical protein [Agrobacterium pusense]QKJ90923.1 hypothetical protein HQN82_05940 [Agrobacterium pusense]